MSNAWADAVSLAARNAYDLPEGWEAVVFKKIGPSRGPAVGVLVTGAVCPPYTRGSRKGEPNWPKRDRSTQCDVSVTKAQISAAEAILQERNGGAA